MRLDAGFRRRRVGAFEVDPLSERMAREHFTYLADAPSDVDVVLGDGRRELELAADGSYDLLILDAFNSDSVPTHLLTVEAVRLYLDKLRPGGVVVFHISSRYLDLKPVLLGAARAEGTYAAVADHEPTEDERAAGAGGLRAKKGEKNYAVRRAPARPGSSVFRPYSWPRTMQRPT